MKLSDFDYNLPKPLIATHPCANRSDSRLLHVRHEQCFEHLHFKDFADIIQPKDLLVLNTTRVIKARLFGRKVSGGKLECLIERIQDERTAWAHIGCSKSPKAHSQIIIGGTLIDVLERKEDLFLLQLPTLLTWDRFLKEHGHIPLPPYIERSLMPEDQTRYQTVYAEQDGAVAAPTAGLHFNHELLEQLKQRQINIAKVLLHVGAGTFQTVRTEDITQHHMHSERIEVSQSCVDQIEATKARGGRVFAVGTTVVRALESAAKSGTLKPFSGESNLFLYPGKKFHVVDALITNFHLPKSSLLMLVSAFAGLDNIRHAYQEAIKEKYRFFSYGDAMLLHAPQNN